MHVPRELCDLQLLSCMQFVKCTTCLGSLATNVIVLQTSCICRSTDIDFNAHWLAFTNDRHAVMMILLFWFALVHIAEYHSIFMQA